MTSRPLTIGAIRLCGPHVYHENTTLLVVPDADAGAAGMVTVARAEALVERGEAMWIDKPRGVTP